MRRTPALSEEHGTAPAFAVSHEDGAEPQVRCGLDALRAHGYRRTVAPCMILTIVAAADTHLTAVEIVRGIHDQAPTLDRTTARRGIAALLDAKAIHAVPGPTATRYGLTDQPHHHAVCRDCGLVQDIPVALLGSSPQAATAAAGWADTATSVELVLYGRCPNCVTRLVSIASVSVVRS